MVDNQERLREIRRRDVVGIFDATVVVGACWRHTTSGRRPRYSAGGLKRAVSHVRRAHTRRCPPAASPASPLTTTQDHAATRETQKGLTGRPLYRGRVRSVRGAGSERTHVRYRQLGRSGCVSGRASVAFGPSTGHDRLRSGCWRTAPPRATPRARARRAPAGTPGPVGGHLGRPSRRVKCPSEEPAGCRQIPLR